MKPTVRDKQTQVILAALDPHDHFEDVMFALKGMDYQEECFLEWMDNNGYSERKKHNEREKLNRFRSANTMAEAQEHGLHSRGFNTIRNLYLDEGYNKLELQIEASNIPDEDVEYRASDYTETKRERKVQRHQQYFKLIVEPRELPVQTFTLNQQYEVFVRKLFHRDEGIYGTVNIMSGGSLLTMQQAIQDLEHKPEYINVNSCTGNGDDNVSAFRHTLIECDDVESIEMQYALLLGSKLPITTITDSGGKSLHALVRVDADSYEEYHKNVKLIREVCLGIGIDYDTRCGDPSRYTRCAGFIRTLTKPVMWRNRDVGEQHPQTLIDTNVGSNNFMEWKLLYMPKFLNRI